ncbi:MAG: DUF3341 domain-containing protein [Flavobacteriales bacterium]|jgi:hypothetical protein|nr:DUF3341 domain-containing protein [Flavobacteriales bacterium]
MSNKVYAIYGDDDILMDAVKDIRGKGVHIDEVYTPFPVHGLDHALGLKHSRLAIASFIYGVIGAIFALWMMWYIMIYNWPQNIGGKPSFSLIDNLPSFIPITFELTVMFAAHLMIITYLIRCKLYPGSNATSPDPRTTDDKFLMEIHAHGNEEELKAMMLETGAEEVKIQTEE